MPVEPPLFVIESFSSAEEFLSVTVEFRATEPVLTTVIGSIAVVGCAARTSPWNLVVSPIPSAAAEALARHVTQVDPGVPGITGVRAVVDAVVEAMGLGYEPRIAMVDTVRVLGEFTPSIRSTSGAARRCDDTDRDLLIGWLIQFGIDAALPLHDVEASVYTRLQARAFWLWEVAGEPVAMTGHAAVVVTPAGTVGRDGPVYTPASQRGRGYGAAVTSAIVEVLQPECSIIMRYADATNPTSNAVYERLGFRVAAEVIEVDLASGPDDFDNHFH